MDMAALMPQNERPSLRPCCKYSKKPWLEGTLDTTARRDFVSKEVPVERATRAHQGNTIFGGKFDGSTTMGQDYKPYDVKREGMIRPGPTSLGNDAPFAGQSTYSGAFNPKEVTYARVRPDNAYKPNKDLFDGTTTNRTDFQPRETPAVTRTAARATSLEPSGAPFAGQSLYKDSFMKQGQAKRGLIVPVTSTVLSQGPFDDRTTNRADYDPKEVARQKACIPKDARPTEKEGWFGGVPSTEARDAFTSKEGPGTQPIRAVRSTGVLPTGTFQGTTTNKADYVPLSGSAARAVRPGHSLDIDKGIPFAGQSTYSGAFNPKEVTYERVRPDNAYKPSKDMFDGTTTNRTDFQPRETPAVIKAVRQAGNIGGEQHPFQGASTYKDDFAKMSGARRQQIVPPSNQQKTGPFDGTTTYGVAYVPKEIPARHVQRGEYCESCVDGIEGIDCI